MECISQTQRRILIGNFYEAHIHEGKAFCVNHFAAMGMKRASVYRILNRHEMQRKKGTGGHNISLNISDRRKLKTNVNNKTDVSQRKLASKYGVSQMTICRTLKRIGIRYLKRKRAPLSTPKQVATQKKRLSVLPRGPLKPTTLEEIVMDDESYFTLDGSGMPGNRGFYTTNSKQAPVNVAYYGKKKFPERVMVWCAISASAVSEVFILEQGQRVDHKIYIDILKSRLLPYIDRNYTSRDQVVFWPDLATCHYHKDVITWLEGENIKTIQKHENPPNAPAIRPIENFWGCLKQAVYSNNWRATSKKQLIRRIKLKLKDINIDRCQALMGNLKTKVRKAADQGLISVI